MLPFPSIPLPAGYIAVASLPRPPVQLVTFLPRYFLTSQTLSFVFDLTQQICFSEPGFGLNFPSDLLENPSLLQSKLPALFACLFVFVGFSVCLLLIACVCVCACVRACVRGWVGGWVDLCARVCVPACVCVCLHLCYLLVSVILVVPIPFSSISLLSCVRVCCSQESVRIVRTVQYFLKLSRLKL